MMDFNPLFPSGKTDLTHAAQTAKKMMPAKPKQQRIDSLIPGSLVNLVFHPTNTGAEPAVFVGITGAGNDRRAKFIQIGYENKPYSFEVYRFKGHWAYGSSADRLSLDSVVELGNDHITILAHLVSGDFKF